MRVPFIHEERACWETIKTVSRACGLLLFVMGITMNERMDWRRRMCWRVVVMLEGKELGCGRGDFVFVNKVLEQENPRLSKSCNNIHRRVIPNFISYLFSYMYVLHPKVLFPLIQVESRSSCSLLFSSPLRSSYPAEIQVRSDHSWHLPHFLILSWNSSPLPNNPRPTIRQLAIMSFTRHSLSLCLLHNAVVVIDQCCCCSSIFLLL